MDSVVLEREALKLPSHERALLADALLGSLDDDAARRAEDACANEAESRHEAFSRGEIGTVDGPSVFQQLRKPRAK